MLEPKIPNSEVSRLLSLKELQILDTSAEKEFDDITKLASEICNVPISLISFIDQDRQWFKSKYGFAVSETPRNISFCGHAINNPNEHMLVPDSKRDPRFYDNPLVTMENGVGFYAGFPLSDQDGNALGTLCLIDHKPNNLTEKQIELLKILSNQIVKLLELRLANIKLNKSTIQLRNDNYKLNNIINSGHLGIAVWDFKEGNLSYSNDFFNLICNHQTENQYDLLGLLKKLNLPDIEKQYKILLEDKKDIQFSEIEINLEYKSDATYNYFDVQLHPIFDGDGEIIEIWIYIADTSEKTNILKNVEINSRILGQLINERTKDLEIATHALKERNEELEQFAYITSHDLQEPLRKIQVFVNLLRESNVYDDKQTINLFDKVESSTKKMREQISDILSYSRLQGIEEFNHKVDLNEKVADAIIDLELLIQEKNASIISDNLPTLIGNNIQLKQLLYNIINNALKFNDKSPKINIVYRKLSSDQLSHLINDQNTKEFHEISINDNGIGFDIEFKKKIFTIFQRLNNNGNYAGTGIGLALVKKIVKNHKGFIDVKSVLGVGSEFKIYFPVI